MDKMVPFSLRVAINKATESVRSAVNAVSASYVDTRGDRNHKLEEEKLRKLIEDRCKKIFFTSQPTLASPTPPTSPKAGTPSSRKCSDASLYQDSIHTFLEDENDDEKTGTIEAQPSTVIEFKAQSIENSIDDSVVLSSDAAVVNLTLTEKARVLKKWTHAINAYRESRENLSSKSKNETVTSGHGNGDEEYNSHDSKVETESGMEAASLPAVNDCNSPRSREARRMSLNRYLREELQMSEDVGGPEFGKLLLNSAVVELVIHAFLIHKPIADEKSALSEFIKVSLDKRASASSMSSTSFVEKFLSLSELLSHHKEHVRLSREHIAEVVKRVVTSIRELPVESEGLDTLLEDLNSKAGNHHNGKDEAKAPASPRSVYLYAADGVSPVEEEIIFGFEKSATALRTVDRADDLLANRERLHKMDTQTLDGPTSSKQASRYWFDSQRRREQLSTTPSLFLVNENEARNINDKHNYRNLAEKNLRTHHEALQSDVKDLQHRLADEESHLKDIHVYRKQKEYEMAADEARAMDVVASLESEKADIEKKLEEVKVKLRAAKARETRLLEEQKKFIETNNSLIDDLTDKCDMTTKDIEQHTRECDVVERTTAFMDAGHQIVRDIVLCGNVTIMDLRDKVVTTHLLELKKLVLWQCDDVNNMMRQLSFCASELSRQGKEEGVSSKSKDDDVDVHTPSDNSTSALVIKYQQIENKLENLFQEILQLKGQADNLCSKRQNSLISTDEVVQTLNDVFVKCESDWKRFQSKQKPLCIVEYEERRKNGELSEQGTPCPSSESV